MRTYGLQREAYRYTCGVTYSLGDVVGLVVAAYSLLDEVHGHGYDHVYVIEKAGGNNSSAAILPSICPIPG